jgi:uncharacterized cupredoxin-like copper-binding protein
MKRFMAGAALAFATLAGAHEPSPGGARGYDYAHAPQMKFGRAADPAKATRVVKVEMNDTMRFTPAAITVRRGEVVRFEAVNKGAVMHEMVLGTANELKEHAEAMRKHPGMEHDEPYMLHVAPGKSGTMGWRFDKAGEFMFGCLVPGHFEAGMVGRVTVTLK